MSSDIDIYIYIYLSFHKILTWQVPADIELVNMSTQLMCPCWGSELRSKVELNKRLPRSSSSLFSINKTLSQSTWRRKCIEASFLLLGILSETNVVVYNFQERPALLVSLTSCCTSVWSCQEVIGAYHHCQVYLHVGSITVNWVTSAKMSDGCSW
jgi:hypothetical protein